MGRLNFYQLDDAPQPIPLAEDYRVERFRPTLERLRDKGAGELPPLPLYLFWYFASGSRYMIYYVRRRGEIVHRCARSAGAT